MKTINWKDHLVNLIVVILGITIAFYLEGYGESKTESKLEEKYISNLRKDLENDLELLDTLIVVNENILRSLIRISEGSTGKAVSEDSVTTYLFSFLYNPRFTPQRTTYESLKSSGSIGLINDFELRTRLIELYEQYYRGADQYDQAIEEHIRDFLKPYFIHSVDFENDGTVNSNFMKSSEFRNIIFTYRYLFRDKSTFYKKVKEELEGVKKELAS